MIRYFLAMVFVGVLGSDVSACSRAGGRARGIVATEIRLVTAPVRFVAAPVAHVVTREKHRIVTRGVATQGVVVTQQAPVIVKAPCPTGGCPLATPPKVTTTETKIEKKTVIDPTLPKK